MANNMLATVGKNLAKAYHKTNFWAKKHSPELLIAGSIVAAATSIVLAVQATLKVETVAKRSLRQVKIIKKHLADDNAIANGEVVVKEEKKALAVAYVKAAWEFTKLYAPAAISFGLFLGGVLSSHKIMKGRNVALASAYSLLDNSFRNYRDCIREKLGEKAENDLFYNAYDEDVETEQVDKKGNVKRIVKQVPRDHLVDDESLYTYLFDASNPDWMKNSQINIDTLILKERFCNEKLISQGYLFLADVYEILNIHPGILGDRKLQAGRVLGWIYDPQDPTRDSYVSFGISDKEGNINEHTWRKLSEGERSIWLTFNPDGDILTGSSGGKTFAKYAK